MHCPSPLKADRPPPERSGRFLEILLQRTLKVDFVSDVSCPWCAIGLESLQQAAARLGPDVDIDVHFQPFELNPDMPAGGQDIAEHLAQKYGASAAQTEATRAEIRRRASALGLSFSMDKRARIYNTFDSHRLLHWAHEEGREGSQLALKKRLFKAYFEDGENPGDHDVLVRLAREVGLDPERARSILASGAYTREVHDMEHFYLEQGIHSVPAIIINERHLIQGGQPVAAFEQALREISAIQS